MRTDVAERVGFEPTVLSHTAFRERHHQPLGHLSAREDTSELRSTRARRSRVGSRASERRSVELLDLVAADAADDLDAAPERGVLGELEHRAGGAVGAIRDGVDERLDVGREERADAHRAGLHRAEDGDVPEPILADAPRRLADRDDDGVGRRIARLADPIVAPRDHRLVEHGDGGVRPLASGDGGLASASASPMYSS